MSDAEAALRAELAQLQLSCRAQAEELRVQAEEARVAAAALAALSARALAAEAALSARALEAEPLRAAAEPAALRAAAAPPPPPPPPPAVPSHAPLPSPTEGGSQSLLADTGYWGLVDAPLSFVARDGAAASFAPAVAAARAAAAAAAVTSGSDAAATTPELLMVEKHFYALAVSSVPAHIRVGEVQQSATNLYGASALRSPRWTFDGSCKPELATVARVRGDTRPVFVGELKPVDRGMLGQSLYYALMALTGAFFPAPAGGGGGGGGGDGAPGARVFYAAPPLAFALLAFPHVGYFVAVELVGKALVSPASQPFFLGSAEHAAAVAALPSAARGAPVWRYDSGARWLSAPGALAPPAVAWAVCGDGKFRKLVRADARSPARWAEMHAAYAALGELWAATDAAAAPAALVHGTRLLYGAHEALVEMDAVAGRAATDEEATGSPAAAAAAAAAGGSGGGGGAGGVLRAIAEAVAWLAAHAILYTDLRGPNVLIDEVGSGGRGDGWRVRLVDYDDCIVVRTPVCSAAAFRAAMAVVEAARAERRGLTVAPPNFAARLARGDFAALEGALDEAFARLRAAAPVSA